MRGDMTEPPRDAERMALQPPASLLHLEAEWYRVALASIGDAVIATDTHGRITFLNPVAESLTGWTQYAALGVPLERVFKVVSRATGKPVDSPSVQVLREGIVVGLANHTLLVAKDGTEHPIDDSAAPIRDGHDQIAGVVLVFRDVSERCRQEQALQDALEYAGNIIETLREPFVVLDKDLRVVTANRSFYQNFHATPHETQGRFIYDLGNRQWDIPKLRTLLEEVLPRDHAFEGFEVEHDFLTLGRKVMVLNARRIRKPGNHSELILLAIEDITDRRTAEVAVQTSELRYRRLFETAKDGILILDADSLRIIDANPFMSELLGYSHAELLGKELWQIGLFRDKRASQALYQELQAKGYIRYEHLPLQTKSGKPVEVEFVSNVYQVDDRAIAQCNIRDIDERSRLEATTHQQAEALADLHRRKDEFLAMLSHELRNPLAPIMNAVQLLRLQRDESNLLEHPLTIIERQLGQLVRLVDDLLEVSRISTGRIHLHRELVDMRVIVERGIETVLPLIDRRRHAHSVLLPASPVWVNADSMRLEQVVVNLLNNAAKYSDDGGRIAVILREDGGKAVLSVRDSGLGIAPDLVPHIFELFTQAQRSLARSEGGLGIGLCLVQRLVELHGGGVTAHSVLGEGSEFLVHLPSATVAPPAPSLPSGRAKPVGPSLRVLVVDDNVDAALSLALLLKAWGHDARTAHDGPVTLELIPTFRPNLVLLDIGLPGLNGFEVARLIRQRPELGNVRLVAMTGYGQDADRRHSLEAGFDDHLVKPADFAMLRRVLETVAKTAI
jgi:PAS domain S-box-containing protein